jgi:hypothetical protein
MYACSPTLMHHSFPSIPFHPSIYSLQQPNGDNWRLLIFPAGNMNGNEEPKDELSVYLECANPAPAAGGEIDMPVDEMQFHTADKPSLTPPASTEAATAVAATAVAEQGTPDAQTKSDVQPAVETSEAAVTQAQATATDDVAIKNGLPATEKQSDVTVPTPEQQATNTAAAAEEATTTATAAVAVTPPATARVYRKAPYEIRFSITLVNFKDSRLSLCQSANNIFHQGSVDWGFRSYADFGVILKPESGFVDEHGAIRLEVKLGPSPDARMLLHDSKSKTGMVGLRNLGATCYLNSLLQTLYHTREFRYAVYCLDTTNDAENDGVALELQRLFWNMQVRTRLI